MHPRRVALGLLVFTLWLCAPAGAQDRSAEVAQKLQGFDEFMEAASSFRW
jgi:hypothetical protein